MASKLAPIAILILCALALCPACTSPTGGGEPSGGTQATPTTMSQSGTQGAIFPGPVVTVPPNYAVEFQENRNHNPIHPDISVSFQGGKGQIFLQKFLVTVVRSDGQVIQKEISRTTSDESIPKGSSVLIQGTTGIDRVVVVATILGKDYKVMDMNDDYNSHP
jgi:hypothetical protein